RRNLAQPNEKRCKGSACCCTVPFTDRGLCANELIGDLVVAASEERNKIHGRKGRPSTRACPRRTWRWGLRAVHRRGARVARRIRCRPRRNRGLRGSNDAGRHGGRLRCWWGRYLAARGGGKWCRASEHLDAVASEATAGLEVEDALAEVDGFAKVVHIDIGKEFH